MIAVNLPSREVDRDAVEGAYRGVALAEDPLQVLGGDDRRSLSWRSRWRPFVGWLPRGGTLGNPRPRLQSGITPSEPLIHPDRGVPRESRFAPERRRARPRQRQLAGLPGLEGRRARCLRMKRALLIAALASLALSGLGAAEAMAKKGVTVKVSRSDDYGKVLMTKGGMALYLFTKDGKGPSDCYDACAVAWPPLLTKGKPVAGQGAIARKLGTTRAQGRDPPGHLRRPPGLLLRARPPRRRSSARTCSSSAAPGCWSTRPARPSVARPRG